MADTPLTYRTVIKNAIDGFNNIQNKIYTNSGQLGSTSTTTSSVTEIVNSLRPATITPTLTIGTNTTGNLTIQSNSSDANTIINSQLLKETDSEYALKGNGEITNPSETNFYIKFLAISEHSKSVSIKVNSTAGLVKNGTTSTDAGTVDSTIEAYKYVVLPKSNISLSGGSFSLNSNNITSSNATLEATNKSGITIGGNVNVKRNKITLSASTGYIKEKTGTQDETTTNFNLTGKYLNGVNIPKPSSSSSTNTFTVNDGIYTWTWNVDSTGNVSIY